MMRYGVVGVGYFGADLARFMNEFDDAQITMVYDPENGQMRNQQRLLFRIISFHLQSVRKDRMQDLQQEIGRASCRERV